MSSSLHTNAASMTALKTLRSIDRSIFDVQKRISTGYKITEAADNAPYWAIANSIRSDKEATEFVKDTLQLGKSRIDLAYTANQQVRKELEGIKTLTVSANDMTAEQQKKIEKAINAKLENIKTTIQSASLNGTTLIINDGQGTFDIAASFRREGQNIKVDKISMNKADLQLATMSGGKLSFDSTKLEDVLGGTSALFEVKNTTASDGSGESVYVAYTSEELDAIAGKVQKALDKISTVDDVLAPVKNEIDSQYEFVHSVINNLTKSYGVLLDADMNAESAKISALQIQQQLAVQALSIANQANQGLLSLFRG